MKLVSARHERIVAPRQVCDSPPDALRPLVNDTRGWRGLRAAQVQDALGGGGDGRTLRLRFVRPQRDERRLRHAGGLGGGADDSGHVALHLVSDAIAPRQFFGLTLGLDRRLNCAITPT
jgi:hypothetical protein